MRRTTKPKRLPKKERLVTAFAVAALLFASTAVAVAVAHGPVPTTIEAEPLTIQAGSPAASPGTVHVTWYNDFTVNVTTDEEIVYLWVEFCIDATVGYEVDGVNTMVHEEHEVVIAVTVRILTAIDVHEEHRFISPNKEEVCPDAGEPTPSPSPSVSPSPSPTSSPEPSPSPSPTPSPEPSPSPSPSPSPTPSDSPSPSPSPSDSPEPSPTPTASGTPTPTPSPSDSPAPTGSPSPTPTGSPSPTPTGGPGSGCDPRPSGWSEDDHIVVEWTERKDATEYRLYRSHDGDGFTHLATTGNNTTRYEDNDVAHGETFQYRVTAVVNGTETEPCGDVEVSAVPFFASILAAGLAATTGMIAYRMGRPKR